MTRVPAEEPYAAGQTLADAAIFRSCRAFFVPTSEKRVDKLFFRFTGIKLPPNTRMGLGVIGNSMPISAGWAVCWRRFCMAS